MNLLPLLAHAAVIVLRLNEMRTDLVLLNNIRALLDRRGDDQRDLAMWMGHHETWLSKILNGERGLRLKEIDRMADFFGVQGYQLLSPGIAPLTERRRGERRGLRERRSSQDRRRGGFSPRVKTRITDVKDAGPE